MLKKMKKKKQKKHGRTTTKIHIKKDKSYKQVVREDKPISKEDFFKKKIYGRSLFLKNKLSE